MVVGITSLGFAGNGSGLGFAVDARRLCPLLDGTAVVDEGSTRATSAFVNALAGSVSTSAATSAYESAYGSAITPRRRRASSPFRGIVA
jgi:hypothetical protein